LNSRKIKEGKKNWSRASLRGAKTWRYAFKEDKGELKKKDELTTQISLEKKEGRRKKAST